MAAEFPEIGPGVLGGNLQTLTDLYKSIDDDFKTVLFWEKGLYEYLLVPKVNILTPVVDKLLNYFDRNTLTFLINGQRLGITLQDVLFICPLPIKGNIVLIQHCPSDEAFKNVFLVQAPDDRKTLGEFYLQIACNTNLPLKQRKIAVLMIIIRSIVMPSSDKNYLPTAFISLLEDEDFVSKYAWGAALLSFLLTGI